MQRQGASGVGKPKDRCFWGRNSEAQASFGVDLGSLWGVRGRSGGSGGGRGRPPAADFFNQFKKFKIMKLCGNLNLLLKRLEID